MTEFSPVELSRWANLRNLVWKVCLTVQKNKVLCPASLGRLYLFSTMSVNYTGNFTGERDKIEGKAATDGLKRSYFSNQAIQAPVRKSSANFDIPNGCLAFSKKESLRVHNGAQPQANPQCRPTTTSSYISANHRLLRHGGLRSPEPISGISKLSAYGKHVSVHPLHDESINSESNVEKILTADNRKSSNHLLVGH